MCDEGETADRADAVRTESQKMESRAGETARDGSARSIIVLIVVGMLVGVLSGTFGIGGGTVIVPALVWLGLSQRNAAATSTLAIVPTSIPLRSALHLKSFADAKIRLKSLYQL